MHFSTIELPCMVVDNDGTLLTLAHQLVGKTWHPIHMQETTTDVKFLPLLTSSFLTPFMLFPEFHPWDLEFNKDPGDEAILTLSLSSGCLQTVSTNHPH